MQLIVVIIILIIWGVLWCIDKIADNAPGVKDWETYNREAIKKTKEEIKKGLKSGRW